MLRVVRGDPERIDFRGAAATGVHVWRFTDVQPL